MRAMFASTAIQAGSESQPHRLLLAAAVMFSAASVPLPAAPSIAFIEKHCAGCHNDVDKEGNFDLTSFKFEPGDAANFAQWVKVHDRLEAGEMPPKEKKRPDTAELAAFVRGLSSSLMAHEQEIAAREGRAVSRRLNGYEYENALRDLFSAPWLQVKGQFPEDGEAHRFNKVGHALDVSHVHMARYMAAADYAIREVLAVRFVQPATSTTRYHAREDGGMTNFWPNVFTPSPERLKFPVLGTKGQPEVRARQAPLTVGAADPHMREQEAVGWIHGNYVTGFGSGWHGFRAPVAGRYRVRFSGYTIWVGPGGQSYIYTNEQDRVGRPKPPDWWRPNADDISPGRRYEPITVYTRGALMNRRVGEFDLTTEPAVHDLGEIWLLANESIITDASRLFRSRPGRWRNPLAQPDGQPGVAFRWMEVEGPFYDAKTTAGYRLLFGDLPLRKAEGSIPGVTLRIPAQNERSGDGRRDGQMEEVNVEIVSSDPMRDAAQLVHAFVPNAYRRPAGEREIQRFVALVERQMKAGLSFTEAMLAGYTAVLASPGFVFLDEKPGRLDDHAVATRLALFLWNSTPDARLRTLAARGELRRPDVLRAETERLLDDPKSRRFVDAFLDYWVDARKMEETTPSTTLYNDYYLDDALTEAALAETQLFFADLLQRDGPAKSLISSDYAFLNDRLALHYDVPRVDGIRMRRVALPTDHPRGGLLTQATVLKVTANGTTTSPVLRGKWITERILGLEIPPPPPVPAVEPDIRGAVTIRQQLEKHRADPSCASCHSKMDPPGFALESFDVMGGWRDRYRAVAEGRAAVEGRGKNGHAFEFYFGLPVDAAGEMPDGQPFADIREFKRLLLAREEQVARNLTRQLIVYATGAPARFSDRAQVEAILGRARARAYGVRTLVHEIVQSDLFLTK